MGSRCTGGTGTSPLPTPSPSGSRDQPAWLGTRAGVSTDPAGVTAPRRGMLNGQISRRLTSLTRHCPGAVGRPLATGPLLPGGRRDTPRGSTSTPRSHPGAAWIHVHTWSCPDAVSQGGCVVALRSPSRGGGSESCCSCISDDGFRGTPRGATAKIKTGSASGCRRRGTGCREVTAAQRRAGGAAAPHQAMEAARRRRRRRLSQPSPRACRCMPLTHARYRTGP